MYCSVASWSLPVKELDAHCAVHAHNICSTCGPDNYKVQACCSPQMEPRHCPSMFAFWEALEEAPMVPPSECDYILQYKVNKTSKIFTYRKWAVIKLTTSYILLQLPTSLTKSLTTSYIFVQLLTAPYILLQLLTTLFIFILLACYSCLQLITAYSCLQFLTTSYIFLQLTPK